MGSHCCSSSIVVLFVTGLAGLMVLVRVRCLCSGGEGFSARDTLCVATIVQEYWVSVRLGGSGSGCLWSGVVWWPFVPGSVGSWFGSSFRYRFSNRSEEGRCRFQEWSDGSSFRVKVK